MGLIVQIEFDKNAEFNFWSNCDLPQCLMSEL